MLDYTEVAQEAAGWARNTPLSGGQRRVAEQLADIAEILTMGGYGCPSEHTAAEVMYRYLHSAFESEHALSLPLFQFVRERRITPHYMGLTGNR